MQVAGRAGRADKPGTVLIQSRNPDHPLLHLLLSKGYNEFASQLLEERSSTAWPPFVYIALIRADDTARGAAFDYLDLIRQLAIQESVNPEMKVDVLGPAHAPMERVAGRFRAQLLLLCDDRTALHRLLNPLRPTMEQMPESRRVRWSIDVDPHDML